VTVTWKRCGRAITVGGALLAGLVLGIPADASADWIVAGFTGHPWTMSSTATVSIPERKTEIDLIDLHYRSESFKTPPYYGYRLTWIPAGHPGIGIEAEFIHAKVFAETERLVRVRGTLDGAAIDQPIQLSSVVQNLAMSHGLNFVFANLALRHGIGEADSRGNHRLTTVLRAGAGPTVPHAESTIEGVAREQYESGGIGVQAGAAIEAALGAGLRGFAEYKFTWASPHIDVAGGEATIPARSNHLAAGLAYKF
jgi:hypothetical protein